ncbi:hypothetical protein SGFS_044580 [Streptomyces graminofaciens]|uniref:Uncharacterized protein n=1 Tax=Streptomyces graminofaciens TaxID=68212 RepID=A0ABN5VIL9_9ACTN|nr:hypothetical protein SGFS_044580 [Streptomyces graminofaciens]
MLFRCATADERHDASEGGSQQSENYGYSECYGTRWSEERVVLHGRLRSIAAPPPPAGPS